MAKGRLIVNSGMRAPRTGLSFGVALGDFPKTDPHTGQRIESLATLVPQTGHMLVGVGAFSDIVSGDYTSVREQVKGQIWISHVVYSPSWTP
jgi:hypothetical protein